MPKLCSLHHFSVVIYPLYVHGQAVVCGIFRSGRIHFHPSEDEVLKETDKLLLIAPVCGRRRPQYTVLNVLEGTQNSSHYSESRGGQRSSSMAVYLKEAQQKNIVKRPSKSLSKVGCPMNYDTLKVVIINIRKSAKCDEKVSLSIVMISNRDWLIGDAAQVDKQLAYTILLAENICQKHGFKVENLVSEIVDTGLGKQARI